MQERLGEGESEGGGTLGRRPARETAPCPPQTWHASSEEGQEEERIWCRL